MYTSLQLGAGPMPTLWLLVGALWKGNFSVEHNL